MDYHIILYGLILLYWIVTGIVKFFRWAGRQVSGAAAVKPNPIQQAVQEAQPPPQQIPAGNPAVPRGVITQDLRRREQELQAESERANAYFRQRAEALRAERDGIINSPPQESAPKKSEAKTMAKKAVSPSDKSAAAIPLTSAAPVRLFQTQEDLVRAFILREALSSPLCRRHSKLP